jgi:hypothetical protein
MQQGVNASGVVTSGSGTCFPDAVLVDCNGLVTHQLKGPAGAGFFQPYYGQWVDVNGAEQTCAAGDTYLQVVSISPQTNPCPGGQQQQPTATATLVPGQPTPTPDPANPVTNTNLASGKAIYASSSLPGLNPELAIDGNMSTFWSSEPGRDPWRAAQNIQWIYIDLASPQQIQTMRIHWAANRHARGYGVYVWSDQSRGWRFTGSTDRGDGGLDEWTVQGGGYVEAQQFMIYMVNPYLMGPTGSPYEISEWEFFGSGAPAAGSANVAQGGAATAVNADPAYPAANAVDGDTATEWRSTGGLPSWIYADLGTAKNVNRAILRWSAGLHASDYTMYYWNTRAWVPMHTQRNGQGGDESVSFFTVNTRYVLLYANSGPGGNIGLREFEVYEPGSTGGGGNPGVPTPPAPPPPPLGGAGASFDNNPSSWNADSGSATRMLLDGREDMSAGRLGGHPTIRPEGVEIQSFDMIRADLNEKGIDTMPRGADIDLPNPETLSRD